ncbi:Bifunctional riboflavin kinase/FMN phosphatase [Linum perenne]
MTISVIDPTSYGPQFSKLSAHQKGKHIPFPIAVEILQKVPRQLPNFVINNLYRSSIFTSSISISADIKMSAPDSAMKPVSAVILDLDGTLLDTDGLVAEIMKGFLVKYGKQWDGREALKILGKTPAEASAVIVQDYELPCSSEEFMADITPLWGKVKALPGANRLVKHLKNHKVPVALASNSPKASIEAKISCHQGWKESFSVIIGGDEVRSGKPSPEIFLEAAKKLNVEPSCCLVIEDSVTGVTGGKAAGMQVVAVPSIPKQSDLYTEADEVINSLLDLHPEKWGLPSFEDWIEGTLPIEPWHIGGPVIKGYGRGSKVLGIPTANLSTEGYSDLVSQHPSGVYFGWAKLSTRGVYKFAMSIGWNPYFNNTEKTIEPWLLHDFEEDFYGEDLRLVIVGYIRPEANFPSLESLIEKIHEDGRIAEKALDLPQYSIYKDDPFFKSS